MSCQSNVNRRLDVLLYTKITIPQKKMVKRNCALDSIAKDNSQLCLVKYFENVECGSCFASNLAKDEIIHIDNNENICPVYVIQAKQNEVEDIYRNLCLKRVKGTVFIDTCKAFLKANPQIPDNELFHTFVINKEGKVLMVGNPFQNEKMEALFKKVIANEQKKQKTKKPA